MDFDAKAFNIIFVIFQMKLLFQHIYVCLNEKLVQFCFVKSREQNFSIIIKMVKSIHTIYDYVPHQVLQLFESF
jgi:hypothetical protein